MPADNPMSLSPPRPVVATTTGASTSTTSVFASVFSSSAMSQPSQTLASSSFSNHISALARSDCPSLACGIEPTSLSLSPSLYLSNNSCSLFSDQSHIRYAPSPQPAMSATALLQRAAEIGASSSTPSFLRGLGLAVSSSSSQDANGQQEDNSESAAAGLGLGLGSGLTDVMMDPSSLFGNKPTTLDLLGVGIVAGGAPTSGLSALLTSFGSGFNVRPSPAPYGGRGSSPGEPWEGATGKNPNRPSLP